MARNLVYLEVTMMTVSDFIVVTMTIIVMYIESFPDFKKKKKKTKTLNLTIKFKKFQNMLHD